MVGFNPINLEGFMKHMTPFLDQGSIVKMVGFNWFIDIITLDARMN